MSTPSSPLKKMQRQQSDAHGIAHMADPDIDLFGEPVSEQSVARLERLVLKCVPQLVHRVQLTPPRNLRHCGRAVQRLIDWHLSSLWAVPWQPLGSTLASGVGLHVGRRRTSQTTLAGQHYRTSRPNTVR